MRVMISGGWSSTLRNVKMRFPSLEISKKEVLEQWAGSRDLQTILVIL
jgi:hypothetical protein